MVQVRRTFRTLAQAPLMLLLLGLTTASVAMTTASVAMTTPGPAPTPAAGPRLGRQLLSPYPQYAGYPYGIESYGPQFAFPNHADRLQQFDVLATTRRPKPKYTIVFQTVTPSSTSPRPYTRRTSPWHRHTTPRVPLRLHEVTTTTPHPPAEQQSPHRPNHQPYYSISRGPQYNPSYTNYYPDQSFYYQGPVHGATSNGGHGQNTVYYPSNAAGPYYGGVAHNGAPLHSGTILHGHQHAQVYPGSIELHQQSQPGGSWYHNTQNPGHHSEHHGSLYVQNPGHQAVVTGHHHGSQHLLTPGHQYVPTPSHHGVNHNNPEHSTLYQHATIRPHHHDYQASKPHHHAVSHNAPKPVHHSPRPDHHAVNHNAPKPVHHSPKPDHHAVSHNAPKPVHHSPKPGSHYASTPEHASLNHHSANPVHHSPNSEHDNINHHTAKPGHQNEHHHSPNFEHDQINHHIAKPDHLAGDHHVVKPEHISSNQHVQKPDHHTENHHLIKPEIHHTNNPHHESKPEYPLVNHHFTDPEHHNNGNQHVDKPEIHHDSPLRPPQTIHHPKPIIDSHGALNFDLYGVSNVKPSHHAALATGLEYTDVKPPAPAHHGTAHQASAHPQDLDYFKAAEQGDQKDAEEEEGSDEEETEAFEEVTQKE